MLERAGLMQNKMVIGLTGRSGSGKSTVSGYLRELGHTIIDADAISHEVILRGKPAYDEIVAHFGSGILGAGQEIDRKKLGEIVFHQEEELSFLNICSHKYILWEIDQLVQTYNLNHCGGYLFLDAPLLFETGLDAICDQVWLVTAPQEDRITRIMVRDHLSKEEAYARLKNQNNILPMQKIDVILQNGGTDKTLLFAQVDTVLKNLDLKVD